MKRITFSACALVLLLPLAACSPSIPEKSASGNNSAAQPAKDANDKTVASGISGKIQKAMQEAKKNLATENIDVGNSHLGNDRQGKRESLPKAEITPQGELLVAGKTIAATPSQHTLLLDYRQQMADIAQTGMDIGTQGADLGINAAKTAIWGALSGKSDKDIDAAIKPQTDKIQAAAIKLCQRMPDLLSSQQKLAAAMPAFKPYATMKQKDVDDCGKDITDKNGKKGFAVYSD